MRDIISSQKLILCTYVCKLIILVYFHFNSVLYVLIATYVFNTVQTFGTNCVLDQLPMSVHSTNYLCLFTSTSRECTFLPHRLIRKVLCQTTYLQCQRRSWRRLRKQERGLKAVAEAKEPQKKNPYIKSIPEYKLGKSC